MIKPLRWCRRVKWWFNRANHKLPPCDCWDYKNTLVDNIEQGLAYLLNDGAVDWEHPTQRKQKKELEFVLDWAREFPYYDSCLYARDEEEKKALLEKHDDADYIVCTKKDWIEWQKRTEKAFKYLAKNLHGLWD